MRGKGRVHQGNSEGRGGARLCSKNQEGPHCRVRSGTGPKQRPEGRQGDLSGQGDGDFGWVVGPRPWCCHSQLFSFMEASPAGHGPNPPICASGLLEGPQCGLSHAEKTHRRPSVAGNKCPRTPPVSGFLETSSPAQPERPSSQIICHHRGWNMVEVGESHAGMVNRLNFSGVYSPPKRPRVTAF